MTVAAKFVRDGSREVAVLVTLRACEFGVLSPQRKLGVLVFEGAGGLIIVPTRS
jgi:hypothetical protein